MYCDPGQHKRTMSNTPILSMFPCSQGLNDQQGSFMPCLNEVLLHIVPKIIESDELAQKKKTMEPGIKVNISYRKGFFFCYFIRERKWVTQNVTDNFTSETAFVFQTIKINITAIFAKVLRFHVCPTILKMIKGNGFFSIFLLCKRSNNT